MQVFDPSVEFPRQEQQAALALKVDNLEGKVVGLLNHHGNNVSGIVSTYDPFFEALKADLERRYKLAGVIWRTKPNLSRVAPAEMLDEIASRADVVINGTCS